MKTQEKTRPPAECAILWDGIETSLWDTVFARIPRSNLLQSRLYGDAMATLNRQRVRRGLILREGREAGLVQILEAGLMNNMIHGAHLDRGPLWLEGEDKPGAFEGFLTALRRDYPKRLGRRMRFIPETPDTPNAREALIKAGFRCIAPAYETLWLDLRKPLPELRSGLKSGWAGSLRKAERAGLGIIWDDKGALLPWFAAGYAQDKRERAYPGPAAPLLTRLCGAFLKGKNALIGCATLDGQPLAGVLIFCHGKSATYQAGWTTASGRERCAHHLLLWGAAEKLKEREVDDFDLGGVDAERAAGVKSFKDGMGAKPFKTPGLWV